jgi:hypothetical protein
MTMSGINHYAVLMATLRSADPAPPEPDRAPAPWEAKVQATCECLSWRGALDNLERRQAEDTLGETTYADFPADTRAAVVTAHSLLVRGVISEHELETRMNQVRARFQQALGGGAPEEGLRGERVSRPAYGAAGWAVASRPATTTASRARSLGTGRPTSR